MPRPAGQPAAVENLGAELHVRVVGVRAHDAERQRIFRPTDVSVRVFGQRVLPKREPGEEALTRRRRTGCARRGGPHLHAP